MHAILTLQRPLTVSRAPGYGKLLQLLYDNCKVKVKLKDGYTPLIDSNAGLGQGGISVHSYLQW